MSDLGEWDQSDAATDDEPESAAETASGEQSTLKTYYPDVAAFLTEWFAPNYRRYIDDGRTRTWCPEWYEHPEAVARLDAMWMAWEQLRTETAMGSSKWWLDHADRHMAVLLNVNGPFMGCTITRGHNPSSVVLPLTIPPGGLYDSTPMPAQDVSDPST